MKIIRLLLVFVVAGFYGCSDKEDAASSGGETTSLIEKSGKTATESLDKVTGKIGEAVDSVKQTGSQAAIDQASDNTADAQNITDKMVESASLETAAVDDNIGLEQIAMGKTIYEKNCLACHAAGVAGAPKISDAAVWEPRIAQGMDTLYAHAISGFKGSVGYMPPKGGFTTLNDDEVKAAVAYMVSASQ